MSWQTVEHGSWATARIDLADMVEDARTLPGSWKWWPRDAVLVRRDQWANLPISPPDPPPVAQDIIPNSGPEAGGTLTVVILNAPGAADVTGVSFDGVPATGVSFTNPNQIRSTSPPGTGTVHVIVHTPRGDSNPVQFNYNPADDE
jgi:hypothetical protein